MSKLIPLTKGKFAIVDDTDYEWLNQWKWQFAPSKNGKHGYARRTIQCNGKKSYVAMHREIMNAPKDKQVDHINNNGLDNQRNNLRLATVKQNCHNVPARGKSSKYKGVTFHKRSNRWQAQITIDSHTYSLGYFGTQREAAAAYNKAAITRYGSYARVNQIEQLDISDKPLGKKQSSKYKGVSFRTDQNCWRAYVSVNKKRIYLGSFDNEIDAARAHDAYIKKNKLTNKLNF